MPPDGAPTARDWNRMSRVWRRRLDERIEMLEHLRDDLSDCIGCGCLSLRTCALYNPQDAATMLGAGPRYLLGDDPDDVGVQSMTSAMQPGAVPTRRLGVRRSSPSVRSGSVACR